jgi:hypothetical protein
MVRSKVVPTLMPFMGSLLVIFAVNKAMKKTFELKIKTVNSETLTVFF